MRELRRGAGLTQRKFADRLAYSVGLVRRVEQGDVAPSPAFVRALARQFGLRPEDVDPTAAASIVINPSPHPDDAVNLLTEVLAALPGTVEQLDRRHVEGPDGQCVACPDRPWPCVTAWAVARARWLTR